MDNEKKVVSLEDAKTNGAAAPLNTTKRELSNEAKAYITETCKMVVLDSIPRQDLEKYLYHVSININDQTKDFDAAILSIFTTPKTINDLVCINTVTLDLTTQKVAAGPVFFAPIVIRKDKNGIERDAVIAGRYGDISITNSSPTITIAPLAEIDEYYRKMEESVDAVETTDNAE